MDSHKNFHFETEEPASGAIVYHLRGRLRGWPECFEFQESVRDNVTSGRRIVLDMEQLEHVDSTGVGILATLYTSAQNGGGELVLASLSPKVRRILDILWFLRILRHVDTVDEALALPSATPPAES
jgi:anti-sigma B factor antagonist